MLFNRYMEHLGSRRTIDVSAILEDVGTPALFCQVGNDTGLDCRKISDVEFISRFRNKSSPYQLGQCVGDIIIEHLHRLVVTLADKLAGLRKIGHFVSGKIL